MKPLFFAVIVSLCGAVHAQARPELDPNVRALIERKVQAGDYPSLVIGVIDGGERRVFGFAKPGVPAPDGGTVFEIGSVTKTFTGLLLAQAVVAGQVKLDDPVDTAASPGRPMTLLDLATHTSGLPRQPGNLAPAHGDDPYADYGRPALKAFRSGYRLTRAPGSAYAYSNLGMGLLGDVLAERDHKTYAALVAERITGPLHMASTGMGDTPVPVGGHDAFGKPVPPWHFDALAGAGSLRSNADDMLRYLHAMMDGRKQPGSAFYVAQTAQRATNLPDTRIGLAWHLSQRQGTTLVWHNGMTGGYASYIGYTDDGRRGVVVLANAARPVDALALAVLFPELAAASTGVPLVPAVLAQFAGRFELAPGFVLTVSPTANGLSVQATGQPAFAAVALGADRFELPDVGARLTFGRDGKGEVDGVVLHQNGRDVKGRKL
jgi:CubicO group peptidase (beta-lactamase class C family)